MAAVFLWRMNEAIDRFILYLATERGLSENYQLSTRISLEGLGDWLESTHRITDPNAVTTQHIADYLAQRKADGLAPASIKVIVVAAKIFFRFLHARQLVDHDPAAVLPLPRIEQYLPETLNEAQVEAFIESIPTNDPLGLRDRAMIELLYASGLRVSEMANAQLDQLHLEEKVIRVTGKGNKTRVVPLG